MTLASAEAPESFAPAPGAAPMRQMIWAQTVFYPVYRSTDAARGLSPLEPYMAKAYLVVAEASLEYGL